MINTINGKEMNVCFINPNSSFLDVVGYGVDATDALLSAAENSPLSGSELDDWVNTLEQYFISDDAVASFNESGTCRCAFSDNVSNIIEKI